MTTTGNLGWLPLFEVQLERARAFLRLPEEAQRRVLETAERQGDPVELPERPVWNSEIRQKRGDGESKNTPAKQSEVRERSVQLGVAEAKAAAKAYRRAYALVAGFTSRQTGADDAGVTPRSRSIQVGEFEVAKPGGIWVAIGVGGGPEGYREGLFYEALGNARSQPNQKEGEKGYVVKGADSTPSATIFVVRCTDCKLGIYPLIRTQHEI